MEQKRFFPEIVLELFEELIFLMSVPVLRDRSSDDKVDDVHVRGGVSRDGEEMLVWKCISDILSFRDVETRQVVRHQVFAALLVFYLQVEFLKEHHPSYESWLGLFIKEQVFQGRMISVDDDLAPQDVRPELLESVDHRKKLFLRSCVINLSFN